MGKKVHYYLNSSNTQTVPYSYAAGVDLTTGAAVDPSTSVRLKPWDMAIVEDK